VSSDADVARLFDDVKASLGGLDALINNAGIAGPTGGVEEIKPEDWRRTIDVCLTGQFLCAHFAVPMLKAAGGGSIVNLSSAAGRFGYAFRTPYSAAKFGVIGLTQSLAKELGPANIRVNAILPGIVEGPRMTGVITALPNRRASVTGNGKDYLEKVRCGEWWLRATSPAIAYLLSTAGRNISGQSIGVDAMSNVVTDRLASEDNMAKVAVIGSGFVGRACDQFRPRRQHVALWIRTMTRPARLAYIELRRNSRRTTFSTDAGERSRNTNPPRRPQIGARRNGPRPGEHAGDVGVKRAVFARSTRPRRLTCLASSTSAILPRLPKT
jgi:NAD(P)-dependent dehydrogenase (short-subunit alcohol dehydrogenase family)